MTRSLEELRQYLALELLFDNDFKDTSGNGNHGTPNNIEWASTNRGLKPRFNGSSGDINCGNDSSFDITDAITCSFVIKTSIDCDILTKSDSAYAFHVAGGVVRTAIYLAGGGYKVLASDALVSDGEWHHVGMTYDKQNLSVFVDGVIKSTPFNENIQINASDVAIGLSVFIGKYKGIIAATRIYNTGLTSSEIHALDNATSGEYGVRIAEFSHQHDPAAVIGVTADTVLQIGGKLAGDAVDTISDRALSNDANIHGAMPTGDGFLAGGRRFDGVDDYLDCGNPILTLTDKITIDALIYIGSLSGNHVIVSAGAGVFEMLLASTNLYMWLNSTLSEPQQMTGLTGWHLITCEYDGSEITTYIDTVAGTGKSNTGNINTLTGVDIGRRFSNILYLNQTIAYISITNASRTDATRGELFNALAVLPFWSINYRDYPDNVTTYTDRFPHSYSIITSGTFKVDDDKIQCTAAGTLTYSASHEFDGAEYITVTIAGTEYSGTGTITQGNTTVSVAQGSNKITVAMGTGDTIDKIRIQFRATV